MIDKNRLSAVFNHTTAFMDHSNNCVMFVNIHEPCNCGFEDGLNKLSDLFIDLLDLAEQNVYTNQ